MESDKIYYSIAYIKEYVVCMMLYFKDFVLNYYINKIFCTDYTYFNYQNEKAIIGLLVREFDR